jgi:hypothetical protein
VLFFEVGHGVGKKGAEGAGIFEKEGLQGEATLLVEESDVAGGEAGGFGGGVVDESDADAMAVSDEGGFERTALLEVADRFVGSKDDEGIGFGDPVVGERPGGLHEGGEGWRDFELEKGVGGKFEAVFGPEEDAVEEGLAGGVRGVAAHDVDKGFGEAGGGRGGLLVEGVFEELMSVGPREALPERGGFQKEVESVVEGHRVRA